MRRGVRSERNTQTGVFRILRLTLLAPDIVGAILDGQQPESLTLGDLMEPLPMLWEEQRERLGFPERE